MQPVCIPRRAYRPRALPEPQRVAMHQQAEAVRDAYLVFRQTVLAALNAQKEHCGNKSSQTVYRAGGLDTEVKKLTTDLACQQPISWPDLPSLC